MNLIFFSELTFLLCLDTKLRLAMTTFHPTKNQHYHESTKKCPTICTILRLVSLEYIYNIVLIQSRMKSFIYLFIYLF